MRDDNKAKVREQFGPSEAYAKSEVHAKGESLSLVAEMVKPQKSWRALDVATGAGHTAMAVAPHVARMIATDITGEMLFDKELLLEMMRRLPSSLRSMLMPRYADGTLYFSLYEAVMVAKKSSNGKTAHLSRL